MASKKPTIKIAKKVKEVVEVKEPSPVPEPESEPEEDVESEDEEESSEGEASVNEDEGGEISFLFAEGAKFKNYIQANKLFTTTLYFSLNKKKFFIYPKKESLQDIKKTAKKTKKVKSNMTGYGEVNPIPTIYKNTFKEDVCIEVKVDDLFNNLKAVKQGIQLYFTISENDLSIINIIPGVPGNLSMSSVIKVRCKPCELSECLIVDMKSYGKPYLTAQVQEVDMNIVFTSVTGAGKTVINVSLEIYSKGFVIVSKTSSGTQSFKLGIFEPDNEPRNTIDITRETIDILKKLQIKTGTATFKYYEGDNIPYSLVITRVLAGVITSRFLL